MIFMIRLVFFCKTLSYSPLCVFDFGIYARCYGCEHGNTECASLFRLGYFVIGISGTSVKVSILNGDFDEIPFFYYALDLDIIFQKAADKFRTDIRNVAPGLRPICVCSGV